jgi:uncharacterized protein (TIGR02271 family)
MIEQSMVDRLPGCEVIDRGGEKIGSVNQIWLDSRTGRPLWASVHTGLFGLKETFVPLQRAELHDGRMVVPVSKDQVKDAPRIEASGDQMSDDEQMALSHHYGVRGPEGAGDSRVGGDAMTRSEEQLRVGVEREEIGRVRLVKHVVTENQHISVPVSHEEVRLEREPITDANRAAALKGPEISEAEHEVRLHAERPVVNKETVPVERVRLTTDTVTENRTVSGEVRKEQIEVDDKSGRLSQSTDRRGDSPTTSR